LHSCPARHPAVRAECAGAFRIIVVDSLSDKNPLVKQIRRAVSRGTLTEDGYAVAEGVHLLEEALAAKCEVGAVIVAESAHAHYPQARIVSDRTFQELTSTETPQGVLALVRPPVSTLDQMMRGDALVVVLDGVQDPGNAGAILRAAEAFGATGAVFLKGAVNPYNPKCIRGSAGSVFRVPLVASVSAEEIVGRTELNWYAAMPRAQKLASDADLAAPCGMIIGSEGHGVGPILAGRATGLRIPTSGVESLNAAVAAGILLYEACRQRGARIARGTP
jgi:RNA methyltransferase, TrmH family